MDAPPPARSEVTVAAPPGGSSRGGAALTPARGTLAEMAPDLRPCSLCEMKDA